MEFEIVYTCPDWYDGPRGGIADYEGVPHLFKSEFGDFKRKGTDKLDGPFDYGTDTFLLSPIDAETFRLALEDWAIWRRYETAFHQGQAALEAHPALPEERARHEELKRLLGDRLVVDPACAVRKAAEFRRREDASWRGADGRTWKYVG